MKQSRLLLSIGLLPLITSISAQNNRCNWLGARKKVDPYNYVQLKNATFRHAAVSSAHPLASMVGAQIMQQGGNAFDAAIAVQLALAVVYPQAGNIGGGGFMEKQEPTKANS
jgi:gamma-glutamyltranspeptidase/glutathione hydrolase